MDVSRLRKQAVFAYILYILLFYLILISEFEPIVSYVNTFGLIGNILAFPMYWIGLKIHRGERRWPWIWFFATSIFYFLGDLHWAFYEDWMGALPESPNLGDLLYLINSYACCCAFICYIRQIKNMDTGSVFFDTFVSTLALGGLLYRFIIKPLIYDASIGLFPMFFHANMSVIDLALLTGILMIIWGTAHSHFYTQRTLLLGLSFFSCCFVEQISLAIEVHSLPIETLFSPLWSFPFWLFSLTATYPDEDETEEQDIVLLHRRFGNVIDYSQKLMPYFMAAVILCLVGFSEVWEDPALLLVFCLLGFRVAKFLITYSRDRQTCES